MRNEEKRLETLDLLRGLTLVSMILYHGMWDFLYLSGAGASMPELRAWYEGTGGQLWQQSICRTFILLSGFCVPFSRHILRRGLQVSAGGIAVSLVTVLFLYEDRVLFGVLTFLGAAMLLTGALQKLRFALSADPEKKKTPTQRAPLCGLIVCSILFYVTRRVNRGFLRVLPGLCVTLPAVLRGSGGCFFPEIVPGGGAGLSGTRGLFSFGGIFGLLLTGLGFPQPGFYSTDYFSLLPWIFLFWAGLFLHRFLALRGVFSRPGFHLKFPVLNWMGRHSLLLYLLHQPVLYLLAAVLPGR